MRLTADIKRRLARNLSELACGRDNWQLVQVFVQRAQGEFTMQQVVDSDARAEQPYVAVALELLVDREELEVVSDDRRDYCDIRYRKADSAGSGSHERGNPEAGD